MFRRKPARVNIDDTPAPVVPTMPSTSTSDFGASARTKTSSGSNDRSGRRGPDSASCSRVLCGASRGLSRWTTSKILRRRGSDPGSSPSELEVPHVPLPTVEVEYAVRSTGWNVVDGDPATLEELDLEGGSHTWVLASCDRIPDAVEVVRECRRQLRGDKLRSPSDAQLMVILIDVTDESVVDIAQSLFAQSELIEAGADDVLTNATTEHALVVKMSMCVMRARARIATVVEAPRPVMNNIDELSVPLMFSADTEGMISELSVLSVWKSPAPPPTSNSSRQLPVPVTNEVQKAECAVNTDVSMGAFGFKCWRCEKPPLVAEASTQRDKLAYVAYKERRHSRHALCSAGSEFPVAQQSDPPVLAAIGTDGESRFYDGSAFDGLWVAVAADGEVHELDFFSSWLQMLEIQGSRVKCGDDEECRLMVDADGCCSLYGGVIELVDDSEFYRVGRSGVMVTFNRSWYRDEDSED